MPDRKPFILFAFTIAWMPLPAGSNWPWAWVLLQILVFITAIGWLRLYAKGLVSVSPALLRAKPVFVLFGLWLAWIFLQIIPLPIGLLEIVAPRAALLYSEAAAITSQPISTASISVDINLTFQKLMLSFALVSFFALSLVLLNSRKRIKIILWLVVISAMFQSVFGSLMTLSGLEYHLFGEKEFYRDVATGTFINRNHLAGYLEMSLAVGIGLLLAQMKDKASDSWRQKFRNWIGVLLEKKMLLRVMLVTLVIGLVMTHSRMGNTAFFSSLLVCGFVWIFLSGKKPKRSTIMLFISLILIDLYIVGAWFGLDKVVSRLEQTSATTESRDEVVKALLIAIPDYGFAGSGLGTFRSVYPAYKDSNIHHSYLYAHNDYLQFALEAGIAILPLALIVLTALVTAYKAMRNRKDLLYRGLGFASLMSVMAILIHSTVDFNLQIPANAMMFMLMLSFAWVGLYAKRE
jgi:putative inorganic carbon (HCO3(-)) transporter